MALSDSVLTTAADVWRELAKSPDRILLAVCILVLLGMGVALATVELCRRIACKRAAAARIQLRGEFATEVGLPVPDGIEVERLPAPAASPYYRLGYPAWERAKVDGTRDRRYKGNRIVLGESIALCGTWRISAANPLDMNEFVIRLRQHGMQVPLCAEEQEKSRSVRTARNAQAIADSPFRLYARFADDSTGFEHWCADLFKGMGAQVHVTPPSNDGGFDLDIHFRGERTLAECKCYDPEGSKVGRPLLQKLVGANATEHADHLMFITTSDYSAPAIQYADEQGMTLIDGEKLTRMDMRKQSVRREPLSPQDTAWELSDEDILGRIPEDMREATWYRSYSR